ncbi:MAG: hypothetical protein IT285_04275 [Bdellovibrionales bacterium]|nr:hypothetical protein [Bdellovibrionales bacterium]
MARVVAGREARRARALAALFCAAALCAPRPAHAMSREVKTVLVTGIYGAGAGTVLGLTTYPITGELRSVVMGTSVGLYLGIALGIYFICTPDDPGNPHRADRGGEPVSGYLTAVPREAGGSASGRAAAPAWVTLRLASF